jgi:hypothetical protein
MIEGLQSGGSTSLRSTDSTTGVRVTAQASVQINDVLLRRAQLAAALVDRRTTLDQLSVALDRSRFALEALGATSEADAEAALGAVRRQGQVASEAIAGERRSIDDLLRRFTRDSLNVGAVGRGRQGKSRFLQSLTGLTQAEIPDSNEGFTTGTTSLIRHGTPFKARVVYMGREMYWAQIKKYFAEIELTPEPGSLEGFWGQALPALLSERAVKHAAYQHLKNHWNNKDTVRALLDHPPVEIRREEIRRYVTQDEPLFLAVDRLELTVDYPSGLEQVGVIDLPGLGDTNVTDVDRLLSAVRDDMDVVMIIRMPSGSGDDWQAIDIELYSRVEEALPQLPMKDRSVIVLNYNRHQANEKQADRMLRRATGEDATVKSRLARIVDVSDPASVRDLFDAVVSELAPAVAAGDAELVADRNRALALTIRSIDDYLSAARSVLGAVTPISQYDRVKMVHDARGDVMQALRRLLKLVKQSADTPDDALTQCFKRSLEDASKLLGHTSVDEFNRRAASGSRSNTYNDLLDETRIRLSAHFASLEPELRNSLERERARVVQVMLDEGHLRPLLRSGRADVLGELRERFEDPDLGLPENSNLREALAVLADAELTYRGFLQHRVRRCLRQLDADKPLYPVSGFAPDGSDVSEVPTTRFLDAIEQTALSALFGDAEAADGEPQTVEGLFKRIRHEPGWASFAVVEEFVDRVTRGELASLEWETIYRNYLPDIFPESFAEAQQKDAELSAAQEEMAAIAQLAQVLRGTADGIPAGTIDKGDDA